MSIIKSAKTVDEAVKLALGELSADIADVDVKVIEKPRVVSWALVKRCFSWSSLKNEKEFEKKKIVNLALKFSCCKEALGAKSDDIEKIEEFLKGLISNMGVNGEISYDEDEEAINLYINESDDSKF